MNEKKTMKRHLGLRATNAISNSIIHVLLVIISIIWLEPAPRLNTSMRCRRPPRERSPAAMLNAGGRAMAYTDAARKATVMGTR